MAFEKTTTKNKSKMQFSASFHSIKSGKHAGFLNITDAMAREVFGVMRVEDIPAEAAIAQLPTMYNNSLVELTVSDLGAELETKDISEF